MKKIPRKVEWKRKASLKFYIFQAIFQIYTEKKEKCMYIEREDGEKGQLKQQQQQKQHTIY